MNGTTGREDVLVLAAVKSWLKARRLLQSQLPQPGERPADLRFRIDTEVEELDACHAANVAMVFGR